MAIKTRSDIKSAMALVLLNTAPEGSITPEVIKGFLDDIIDSCVVSETDTNLKGMYIYDATKQYYQNEITNYNGNWYVANSDTVIGAFDASYWTIQANNIFHASLTIETADVLTLNGTPLVVIPAVTGKSIIVTSASLTTVFNSVEYATNTTARLMTDTATLSQVDFLSGLNASVSRTYLGRPTITAPGATDTQIIPSKSLKIDVATGNPTAGNSQIIVDVFYYLR